MPLAQRAAHLGLWGTVSDSDADLNTEQWAFVQLLHGATTCGGGFGPTAAASEQTFRTRGADRIPNPAQ